MADIDDTLSTGREAQEHNPDWDKKAEAVFGPQGTEELNCALSAYSAYPKDSLADPATQIEVAGKTAQNKDAVMESLIKTVGQTYISKSGLLKKDIFEAIDEFQKLFKERYPNCFGSESEHSESELIVELRSRFLGYLLYLFISREKDHRKLIKERIEARERKVRAMATLRKYALDDSKVKEFRELYLKLNADPELTVEIRDGQLFTQPKFKPVLNESIYRVITDLEGTIQAESGHGGEMILLIHQLYSTIKTRWLPLLTEESKNFRRQPGNIGQTEGENDRIYSLIKEEGNRDVPMCTTDNSTLMERERLVMQFIPVEKGLKDVYEDAGVQVNYHSGTKSKSMKTDRTAQEAHRTRETVNGSSRLPIAISDPRFPVMFIDRFSGKIRGLAVYPELLKVMGGSMKPQELLRKDILIYLAQLVCKPETLNKIFGNNFLQPPTPQPNKPTTPVLPHGQRGSKNPYVTREYPYGLPDAPVAQRAMAVFTALHEGHQAPITYLTPGVEIEADSPMTAEEIARAIENLRKALEEGEIVSHRRLLPLMRRKTESQEGITYEIIGAFEPTEKAIERARENGRVLRKGIEFPHRGEIFYPNQVPELLQTFGCTTVEDLVALYPNEAYIRHETWVDPEETRRERVEQEVAPDGHVEIEKVAAGTNAGAQQATSPKAIIAKVKLPPSSSPTSGETRQD